MEKGSYMQSIIDRENTLSLIVQSAFIRIAWDIMEFYQPATAAGLESYAEGLVSKITSDLQDSIPTFVENYKKNGIFHKED